jgi:penicillin-binding protein 1A
LRASVDGAQIPAGQNFTRGFDDAILGRSLTDGRGRIHARPVLLFLKRWRVRLYVAAAVLTAAAAAGVATGRYLRPELASVRQLEDYRPPTITRLYDDRGEPLHYFAEERRIMIDTSQIPAGLRSAILAAEDPRFYQHVGVDPLAVARAALADLLTFSKAQGASTITQQLARNLFLHPAKQWRRKLQEALLAFEIERRYTKDEIFTFYINQIYLGHGRYGFEAASRFYFGKAAHDLSLPEAALLAGLAQRPEGFSPIRNPDGAKRRRDHVLTRMVAEGFLDPEAAEKARHAEITASRGDLLAEQAPHFVEAVRRGLELRYGESAIYREGLEVRTTLDSRLQRLATQALMDGLHELDRRIGWRGPEGNVVREGGDPRAVSLAEWDGTPEAGQRLPAIVVATAPGEATLRLGDFEARLDRDAVAWTGSSDPARMLRVGDRLRVRVVRVQGERLEVALEQRPEVEGAMVVIDPATGEVKAMVGGSDYSRSQFNRATQALRQAGSVFKPFVMASALYAGFAPSDVLFDEPTLIIDPQTNAIYQPQNYERDYRGLVTVREALEDSLNIATVRLANTIGYEPIIRLARRCGLTAPLLPYPSLALGAADLSLLEVTSAYGAIANQGVRVEPHLVRDVVAQGGEVREQARPATVEALRPDIAYVLTNMMTGVVQRGTAAKAAALGRPLAGKTGTTDDYTDAWFVGFSPSLVAGVWVGFDQKQSLGRHETGAQAALPIWMAFMDAALAGTPPEPFPRPANVVQVAIDRRTGLRASPEAGCVDVLMESFVEGSAPEGSCDRAEHVRLGLPHPLQHFPIDGAGRLLLSPSDLAWLTGRQGCRVESGGGGAHLATDYGLSHLDVPFDLEGDPAADLVGYAVPYPERVVGGRGVRLQPDGEPIARGNADGSVLPEGRWVGLDGKDAVVVDADVPGGP